MNSKTDAVLGKEWISFINCINKVVSNSQKLENRRKLAEKRGEVIMIDSSPQKSGRKSRSPKRTRSSKKSRSSKRKRSPKRRSSRR